MSATYEYPPQPDCPSCDGRGWYQKLRHGVLVDIRCPCWERRLLLEGPPE
jgi:hypothetical protein